MAFLFFLPRIRYFYVFLQKILFMADNYDIFISYRRAGGWETAKHLNDLLTRDGYSVSFDIDTLREGPFDKALLERVRRCVDFVLVVDPHCFDRTLEGTPKNEDWLRVELSEALRLEKNIIPVLLAGASFPKGLPADIANVTIQNGPQHSIQYFEAFYDKLKAFFHSHPRRRADGDMLPNLKVYCNLDCVLYIDGEESATIAAEELVKVPLREGEYFVRVTTADGKDSIKQTIEMPNRDKLLNLDLLAVRTARLETIRLKEEEERRRKEEEELRRKEEEERRHREEDERKRREEEERKRREVEERKRREVEERKRKTNQVFKVKGVKFTMVYVEGGTFTMGATLEQGNDAYSDEKPAHKVTLDSYHIGQTVVTQALWKAVMSSNPSYCEGDNLPVERVSWDDCQEFIRRLNSLTGHTFRLPTEAEWEFAARGGYKSRGYKYSGGDNIDNVAWYDGNSGGGTHPVGQKWANELGLYDMSGNVWEWCNDWYGGYSEGAQDNPSGPSTGSYRVGRGGGWSRSARSCRVSGRASLTPSYCRSVIGLRLVSR